MRKVTPWCHFENLPPLEPSKPYGWFNIWRKLTCWVIAIDLSSGPLQNTLFDIWTNLASWVMFEMSFPSPTTKQDVERTKLEPQVMFGIYVAWTTHTAIHSTYGSSWHVDSFFWIYLPCPLRNAMFSVWTSMASLLMSKCSLPSPASRQYVEHMERKASWVIFEIYSPSTLQSNTLKKTVKVDTSSFVYGESWHVEFFLKLRFSRLYKANGWTSAENWHVGLFLQFITSRRLHKIQSSTCNIWTKLTCWVVVLKFECTPSISPHPF